jgi:hypothetical protein
MARNQDRSNADNDSVLSSSAQGSVNAGHDKKSGQSTAGKRHGRTRPESFPPSHSASENVVENPTGTDAIEEQEGPTLSWVTGLKCRNRRRPGPESDEDADYTAEHEENIEIGASDTSRTKSTRISKQSKQSKQSKLTQEAM